MISGQVLCTNCRDKCDSQEVTLCLTCHALNCPSCQSDHFHEKEENAGGCVRLHELTSQFTEGRLREKKICQNHRDTSVTHFCQTCSAASCKACVEHAHRNHDVISMKNYLPSVEEAMQKSLLMLRNKRKQLTICSEAINGILRKSDQRKEKIEKKIKQTMQRMTMQFLKYTQEQEYLLRKQLHAICCEQQEELQGMLENSSVFSQLLLQASDVVEENMQSENILFNKTFFESIQLLNRIDVMHLIVNSNTAITHKPRYRGMKVSDMKSAIDTLPALGGIHLEARFPAKSEYDGSDGLDAIQESCEEEYVDGNISYAGHDEHKHMPDVHSTPVNGRSPPANLAQGVLPNGIKFDLVPDDQSVGETDYDFGEYYMVDRLIKVPRHSHQKTPAYAPQDSDVTEDISILEELPIPGKRQQHPPKETLFQRLQNPFKRNKSPTPGKPDSHKHGLPNFPGKKELMKTFGSPKSKAKHRHLPPVDTAFNQFVYHHNKPKTPDGGRQSLTRTSPEHGNGVNVNRAWNNVSATPPTENADKSPSWESAMMRKVRRTTVGVMVPMTDTNNNQVAKSNHVQFRPQTAPPRRHTMWPPFTAGEQAEIFVDDWIKKDFGTYPRLRTPNGDALPEIENDGKQYVGSKTNNGFEVRTMPRKPRKLRSGLQSLEYLHVGDIEKQSNKGGEHLQASSDKLRHFKEAVRFADLKSTML